MFCSLLVCYCTHVMWEESCLNINLCGLSNACLCLDSPHYSESSLGNGLYVSICKCVHFRRTCVCICIFGELCLRCLLLSVLCFLEHSCSAYVGSEAQCHSVEMNQSFSWLLPQTSTFVSPSPLRNASDKNRNHSPTKEQLCNSRWLMS